MRALTKRQIQLLNAWYENNKAYLEQGLIAFDVGDCDLFPLDFLSELTHINDYETLVQDINRYISDKLMEEVKGDAR